MPNNSDVRILIYDISGKKVADFSKSNQVAGWHVFNWNATDTNGNELGTGVYLLTIHAMVIVTNINSHTEKGSVKYVN